MPLISDHLGIAVFLLRQTFADTDDWSRSLLELRSEYSSLKEHFLKYVNHPEYLTAASSDPLADDPDSPWNTLRRDEALRAEILQDVQRLPEVPFYHEPRTQTLILDVLFIYCKLNPDVGGYRQGMHELLAPIVYVLEQDAIDPVGAAPDASANLTMVEMLDASFIEHDAFALFSKVMDHAKSFYEVGEAPSKNLSSTPSLGRESSTSSIVEKSQRIHEVCLHQVDPELSDHLKDIEVLPQIFLIVRWELLEADYSAALQLLLKYPHPQPPHGPHSFVDDAIYLRDHLDTSGGSALITKYTGRSPASGVGRSRPATPSSWDSSIRGKGPGGRSPLSSSRLMSPPLGVEALFQGAAKGVLERGERLGINRAVRDAMVEIRRNVSEAKSSMKANRELFSEPRSDTAIRAVAGMERRNKQLAAMLEETVSTLKSLTTSAINDEQKHREELEIATAKIQLVKIYLEDSTMALPEKPSPSIQATTVGHDENINSSEPLSDAVAAMNLSKPKNDDSPSAPPPASDAANPADRLQADTDAAMDVDPLGLGTTTPVQILQRPKAAIPTRSSLAQSSFSWMLEPDESSSSQASAPRAKPSDQHRKRPSANANRERTAFLFGELPSDENGQPVLPNDTFGLEPIGKSKS
ncbi:hypothetical protein DL764_010992 [Monosporascus ibericus]|uniref:Rab-GAP TBC domain-containing protein n=1 Tax=Monosporascus ibericus TaxID=155417 RepID=A0A4Q4SU06_9PEZI|nr:hypothetical protein DL764_010992 [Monosporascus ibericus]